MVSWVARARSTLSWASTPGSSSGCTLFRKKGTRYSPMVPASSSAWREAGSVSAMVFISWKASTDSLLSERVT